MRGSDQLTGLPPVRAALAVGGALVASGIVSRMYSPDPTHPGIRRWYKQLDKPSYTPPDFLFGAVWPVLLAGLGGGAYRLLRRPASPERDQSVALAALTLALVTTYSKITFGDRNLTRGVTESAMLVAVAAAYVARAAGVDAGAAKLGAPLAAWSTFGSLLTRALRDRNPGEDSGRADRPGLRHTL